MKLGDAKAFTRDFTWSFTPPWWAVLLTAALCVLFVRLGFWQLHRADEKRALQQQVDQGRTQRVDYAATLNVPRYQRVSVTGHYDGTRQILLDNMSSSMGLPGYRVWTPFLMSDGQMLLVDRGWVPLGEGSHRAASAELNVADNPRTLNGVLDELPRPGLRAGDAGIDTTRWPQVLNYPRHDELQRLYAAPLAPRLVLLDADQPDGFERVWHFETGFAPGRHIAYAVQWFGFAVAVIVILLVMNTRRTPTSAANNVDESAT